MAWINEVDSSRNMYELMSSSSILGRKLPDCEVLDSKIASALKKLLTADFKTYMICENFKISGTGEALLDFNDLLRETDNVQGFDTWDEVLLSLTKIPMNLFQRTYKKQLHFSEELKPLMAVGPQDTVHKGEAASYCRLKENGLPFCQREKKG